MMARCISAVAVSLGFFWSGRAGAQACCAAASVIAPGRLALHERALVGGQALVSGGLGSFDGAGRYHGNEPGSSVIDTQFTLFGTVRIVPRLQLSASAPLLLSFRASELRGSESGGGIGDLGLNVRYDAVRDRQYAFLPGIGVIAGLTAPTGRPPESSQTSLGSDVTGVGTFQFSAGLWLERSFGDFLVTAAGWISYRPPRSVDAIELQLAPQGSFLLAMGYSFTDAIGLSLSGTYVLEGDARVDGSASPETGRRQTRIGLGSSIAFYEVYRVLATAFVDLPIDAFGQNQIPQAGLVGTFIWSFL